MPQTWIAISSVIFSLLAGIALPARADDFAATPQQAEFFEIKVRPLLTARCYKCHGEKKQQSGLRLDSRAAILAGGENGPVLSPGSVEESPLIDAINYASFEMPPDGQLPPEEIDVLTAWVQDGAPWPADDGRSRTLYAAKRLSDRDRSHWSFQPVRSPTVPTVDGDWARNEIDQFVLARLKQDNLSPAPDADPRTLIRRLYFDLLGLPPSPAEVEAFAADSNPAAYEKLVDQLLASPHYGERWARHWLDLVRYAESDGFKQDAYRQQAWRYRDYVIRSFNEDKPYDQFITEQLAGDELPGEDPEHLIATGFLRHGTYEYNQPDATRQWNQMLDELTDVTGDVFLGMGMACARCHDHKFDPILQVDYFRLRAFFALLLPRDDLSVATAEQLDEERAKRPPWEAATADIRQKLAEIEQRSLKPAEQKALARFPTDIQALILKPRGERTPGEHQLAELANRQLLDEMANLPGLLQGDDKPLHEELRKKLAEFDHQKPPPLPVALAATDVGPTSPPVVMPGTQAVIEPGFLSVLDPNPAEIQPLEGSTGRRSALARWLTRPENPLTTRVIVNRVWQTHFGRGLVGSSSDFGRLGDLPSHPELLDWLTQQFVGGGWRLKQLHRWIVTSATYRQSATNPLASAAALKDPENRLLWRANVRRLDAEQIRDAMLAVSGEIDFRAGKQSDSAKGNRRSVYTMVLRNSPDPLLAAFDAPDGIASVATRNSTTTLMQSLLLINGEWTLERAKTWACQLCRSDSADPRQRVRATYLAALGREANEDEIALALAAVGSAEVASKQAESEETSDFPPEEWVDFCHAMLNSNEFLYVD